MVAACVHKGVTFRYGIDVSRAAGELSGFDRIVIATGARYRFGLGPLPGLLLDRGAGQWPGLRRLFSWPPFRDWFYHRARRSTGEDFRRLSKPGQKVTVIGDAARAGKSQPAIASAFEAALLGG
jgi:dimethylglycine catabolism A